MFAGGSFMTVRVRRVNSRASLKNTVQGILCPSAIPPNAPEPSGMVMHIVTDLFLGEGEGNTIFGRVNPWINLCFRPAHVRETVQLNGLPVLAGFADDPCGNTDYITMG